jgi:hypothetical protein
MAEPHAFNIIRNCQIYLQIFVEKKHTEFLWPSWSQRYYTLTSVPLKQFFATPTPCCLPNS